MKCIVCSLLLFCAIGAMAQTEEKPDGLDFIRHPYKASATVWDFFTREVRFDESVRGKRPTPKIAKTWRLVGVKKGQAVNSTELWFQDPDGTVYLVQGFTNSTGEFIVSNVVDVLGAQ
jgi:hypothetical protein